jgi:hypothetical protein
MGKGKMTLKTRQIIEHEITRLHRLTNIAVMSLVIFAGVSKRTWHEWKERGEAETKHNGQIPRDHWLTPEETNAIIRYCACQTGKGYRVLCWEMVDRNIASVSPSSVYNIMIHHDLVGKWA